MDAFFVSKEHATDHCVTMAISANNKRHEIWFRCENAELMPTPNALLTAAILPAMRIAEPLSIHHPISSFIGQSWEPLNAVLSSWHDCLQPVSLHAPVAAAPVNRTSAARKACFFTGGVDSCFTLYKHADEIDALIYVMGFDVAREDTKRREMVLGALQKVASHFNKQLIIVETNVKTLMESYIERGWGKITHGAALATIAHLLSQHFDLVYVAASGQYRTMVPWGSHPLLDLLWSSESMRIVYDGGEAFRFDKVRQISQVPIFLQVLRVCWEKRNSNYNCGECEKCIRTMLSLEILDKLSLCTALPQTVPVEHLRNITLGDPHQRKFLFEVLTEMIRHNARPDLQKIVVDILWPYRLDDPPEKLPILRKLRSSLRRRQLRLHIKNLFIRQPKSNAA